MNILGISCFFHDAAAALLRDGEVIASAQEERFTRNKNTQHFPTEAIRACLRLGGMKIRDIDVVVFYEKPLLKLERVLTNHLSVWPRSLKAFLEFIPEWARTKLQVPAIIRSKLGYDGKILFVEHHLSHAAAAFYLSPFEEASILTFDGVGEWTTCTRGFGQGTEIELRDEIRFPHSLGLLFSAVTGYLGFRVLSGEGNMMGLKAYGRSRYVDKLREVIDVKPDGSFRLNLDYFRFHQGDSSGLMVNEAFIKLMGHPPRKFDEEIESHHADIAASLQTLLEDIVIAMANSLHQQRPTEAICLAGGVAHNALANTKILEKTEYQRVFVPPAAGDAGAALGAAVYAHCALMGNPRIPLEHAYLGTEYPDHSIEEALAKRAASMKFVKHDDRETLLQNISSALAEDKVVGWFQGRMELGPRALGGRSILASPVHMQMKDVLNAKIKKREGFRPFASVVPLEDCAQFFELDTPSPFMNFIARVRKEVREKIATVTHVDGTARVQTVKRSQNPLLYDLLRTFGQKTGIPVLLNTSFNTQGEPIVESPEQALECFERTHMDHLAIGGYFVSKNASA